MTPPGSTRRQFPWGVASRRSPFTIAPLMERRTTSDSPKHRLDFVVAPPCGLLVRVGKRVGAEHRICIEHSVDGSWGRIERFGSNRRAGFDDDEIPDPVRQHRVLVRTWAVAVRHQQRALAGFYPIQVSVVQSLGGSPPLKRRRRAELCRRYRRRSVQSGASLRSGMAAGRLHMRLAAVGATVRERGGHRVHARASRVDHLRGGRSGPNDRPVPNSVWKHRVCLPSSDGSLRSAQRPHAGACRPVPRRLGGRLARVRRDSRPRVCR